MSRFFRYFLLAVAPVWAQTITSPTINPLPSREFGQPQLLQNLTSIAPNLVEGREMYLYSAGFAGGAIAIDNSTSPPIVYVADTFNNRVLAWKNPLALAVCGISSDPSCGKADLVIGQQDFTSTLQGGPGQPSLITGFVLPTDLAVDAAGNLYVVDAGNNRILRFPAPFKQTSAILNVDLVIGQQTISSGRLANQGHQNPDATTLSLAPGGKVIRAGIAIDPNSGNLWVTDPGNNRVLRFPASQLAANPSSPPAADIVLGQTVFTTNTITPPPSGTPTQLNMNGLAEPGSIAVDPAGSVYVGDQYSRVMYYAGPFSSGLAAQRVLGVNQRPTQQVPKAPPYPNQYTIGITNTSGNVVGGAPGLFVVGNNLYVCDLAANRITEYDIPSQWPAASDTFPSPIAIAVIGQNDFVSGDPNKGQPSPDNSTLSAPMDGVAIGNEIWVVDSGNNRVLAFQGGAKNASRLVGQLDYPYDAPDLIEGREMFFWDNNLRSGSAGIIVDHNSDPPHVYIADSQNHRILGFKDGRSILQTSRADLVIGQTDSYSSLINSPSNDPERPTATGLFNPTGLALDAAGNLYVADTGDGRVVRFPAPFNQPAGSQQTANLVLGQGSLTSTPVTNASVQNMHSPWGLVMLSDGSLAVSDAFQNRVLIFKHPAGADFQNGQSASVVLGQPDFNSTLAGNGTASMNSPRHIAADTNDRLFVCDTANNRVLIFTNPQNSVNGQGSSYQINGLNAPQGITVSSRTGEIWIANTNANQIWRMPQYDSLILNGDPNKPPVTDVIGSVNPLAVALDNSDNLITAEASNRVSFYFAALVFQNAANYNSQPMAPGMLAVLYRAGLAFNLQTSYDPSAPQNIAPPWPTTVKDLEVLVNGTPAPIFRIDPEKIAIQVPSTAPTSGTSSFVLMQPSTGEIIAAGNFQMAPYSPGFFTQNFGSGQIAAFNEDGTVNSPDNPIGRGHVISFCLTGGGVFPGTTDGMPPTGAVNTAIRPVLLNGTFAPFGIVPDSAILYSGAGCGFAGGWQINFQVPQEMLPGTQLMVVELGDIPSNVGPNSIKLQTTFSVK